MQVRNALQRNNETLGVHRERLSTGLRVNSAKDDPSGLAISERLTAQIRGKSRALLNANDAISLARTADTGYEAISAILQRLREIAIQSINDSNTSSDRRALQNEVSEMLKEIDRISNDLTFNDRKLLDGSFDGVFQIGANSGETVSLNLFDTRTTSLGARARITTGSVTSAVLGTNNLRINGLSIRPTTIADDTVSVVNRASSAISKAKAINDSASSTGVAAVANPNVVTGGAPVPGGLIANGQLRVNNINVGKVLVLPGDADGALRAAINAKSALTGVTASLDGSNRLVLTAADGRNVFVIAIGPGSAASGLAFGTTFSTMTLESDDEFTIGGTAPGAVGLMAGTVPRDPSTAIGQMDVTTGDLATEALGTVDAAIRQLSRERARVGAFMGRLDSIIAELTDSVDALEAARSRILDADIAQETSSLIRQEILQKADASVLAQANVSSDAALALLLLGKKR